MGSINAFITTLELYFNAFCGIIAGVAAIVFILLALRSWKRHDLVAGAMFLALAALAVLIGVTGLVTAISIIMSIRAAAGG